MATRAYELPDSTELSSTTELHHTYYMHVEAQSERLMRLSNALADLFIGVAMRMGHEMDDCAEAADALAQLSNLVKMFEQLGHFGIRWSEELPVQSR